MCQKIHGAAFGTYCFVKPNEIVWTSDTKSIVHYESSKALVRSSCSTCGSVVPYASKAGDHWVAPGGCHDEMRKPDYNIFVVDSSPWHTINSDLPQCNEYPNESGIASVGGIPVPRTTAGPVLGSCLCGAISYEVTEEFQVSRNCHCSRCRHGRAAAHASNGLVSFTGVKYLSGEDRLRIYKVPDAKFFAQAFCDTCSSLMPYRDPERNISIVPLSSLDVVPNTKPSEHIHTASKADWHDITDELPQYQQGPAT